MFETSTIVGHNIDMCIFRDISVGEFYKKTSSTKVEIGHGPPKMMNKPTD